MIKKFTLALDVGYLLDNELDDDFVIVDVLVNHYHQLVEEKNYFLIHVFEVVVLVHNQLIVMLLVPCLYRNHLFQVTTTLIPIKLKSNKCYLNV